MFSGLMLTQYTQGMLVCEDRILSAPGVDRLDTGRGGPGRLRVDGLHHGPQDEADPRQRVVRGRHRTDGGRPGGGIPQTARRSAAARRSRTTSSAGTFEKLEEDRPVHYDINRLAEVIRGDELLDAVEREVGRLVSYPAEPFGTAGLAAV